MFSPIVRRKLSFIARQTGYHCPPLQLGICFSRTGRFGDAAPWFERAVAEKDQGDIHGRVDQDSLCVSLHGLAACLTALGRAEDAAACEAPALVVPAGGASPRSGS